MILDTSALLAILQREPEAVAFAQAIEAASVCRVSAATLVEASIVMAGRRGPAGVALLDRLLQVANIEIVPVDAKQAMAARSAWERYGLGNHSAGLNSGDCFAYALAGVNAEPLLFKGDDFSRTDIVSACP